MLRVIVGILWVLVILNLVVEMPDPLVTLLYIIGVFMLVAHTIEFFVFTKKIKAKQDGMPKSFLMTLVFGLTYIL